MERRNETVADDVGKDGDKEEGAEDGIGGVGGGEEIDAIVVGKDSDKEKVNEGRISGGGGGNEIDALNVEEDKKKKKSEGIRSEKV